MRLISLAAIAVGLAACNPVVEMQWQTEAIRTQEEQQSCHYSGLCVACGTHLNFKAKLVYECGIGMHFNCPGHQQALVSYTPVKLIYKDGSSRIEERRVVNKELTECK